MIELSVVKDKQVRLKTVRLERFKKIVLIFINYAISAVMGNVF